MRLLIMWYWQNGMYVSKFSLDVRVRFLTKVLLDYKHTFTRGIFQVGFIANKSAGMRLSK